MNRSVLDQVHERLSLRLANGSLSAPLAAELVRDTAHVAVSLLQSSKPESAFSLLDRLVQLLPGDANAWRLLGQAYGAVQSVPEARRAFARAAMLLPDDVDLALSLARATLDAGLPAVALFEQALSMSSGSLAARAGLAASLVEDGHAGQARVLLADALTVRPDWLAGHKALADLRWISGDHAGFDRSYGEACVVQPQNLPLRLAWFGALMQVEAWARAGQVLVDGEAKLGSRPALTAAMALLASESGDEAVAEQHFGQVDSMSFKDPGTGLARLRHCLRSGGLDIAQALASAFLSTPAAPMFWPYQSIIWRRRADSRADWLDGGTDFIRSYELGLSVGELAELVHALNGLHAAASAFPDQSVRGGTQTHVGRQLLFRADPRIQHLRQHIRASIARYIEELPPVQAGHPLLGTSRSQILFSGSWSVRLSGKGHHVSHTHPGGWISSALYIAVPAAAALGTAPAGWIRFGTPPLRLGPTLAPYTEVEPSPGRLVLFPSTMWHQTVPFVDGERLVVAFDVMRRGLSG